MNNDTQVISFHISRGFISPVNNLYISYFLTQKVVSYLFLIETGLSMPGKKKNKIPCRS